MNKTVNKTVNKKGQAVLESVLIMVALLSLALFVFDTIKKKEWVNDLRPSKHIEKMARVGSWGKNNPNDWSKHPNHLNRRLMYKGREPKP